jgi:nitroreductase
MNQHLENLNWRYATKSFTDQEISDEDLQNLLDSVQLSASSYGLQPYKVAVVSDPKIKKQLREAGFNQPQITECSHLFVFAGFNEVTADYLESYIKNTSKTRGIPVEELSGMRDAITNTTLQFPQEKQQSWSAHQAYLALGFLLNAAATYHIDVCPMEGFENDKFDEILGLKEQGVSSAAIAAVGYRSEDDKLQGMKKVRKSQKDLFLKY